VYDDGLKNLNPENIQENDIILVNKMYIDEYFQNIHPRINNKYTLITRYGVDSINDKHLEYIDDKIIKWYGQNINTEHPKLIPLPLGLEDLRLYSNGITKIFDKLKKRKTNKKNRILFGFAISTNSEERQPAYDVLKKNKLADEIIKRVNPKEHHKLLNTYKFVASPPGRNIDCHRTWEAIYLKVVPIVKKSILTDYFYKLGAPLWVIDDWKELENLEEKDLEKKYNFLKERFKTNIIYTDYWIEKIKKDYVS
jgi:hypothetical protein